VKTLVTGATGFVGSKLTQKLLDLGHDVRILSRSGRPPEEFRDAGLEVVRGDISDNESVIRAAVGCKYIFHLAGVVGYAKALQQEMVMANVVGTANIIEASIKNKIEKLFYMSSVVAIGAAFRKDVLNEESPYNVGHLNLGYFETKHRAEQLVKDAVKNGQVNAVIANPTTIYGAGDARKGSRKVQIAVAQGRFKFYTAGGANIVHIDDCIDGCMKIFEKGRPGERYILAGDNLTIKEIFTMIAKEAGVTPPFIYLPTPVVHALGRIGDWQARHHKKGLITSENAWTSTLYHWFSADKARRELGFNPRPSRLAVAESIRWMREQKII
jgi:dihydroflavonol-4-reductase